MEPLTECRAEIDRLDRQIVELLAQRWQVARRVAALKQQHGIAVRLPDRIALVIERARDQAAALGADPEFVGAVYAEIVEQTCRAEEKLTAAAGHDHGG